MKDDKTMRELAEELGLEVVETTSEATGYPRALRDALTGFATFEDAEQVAEANGLQLVWIDRRDGWQLWHRGNTACCPMELTESDYGDDYEFVADAQYYDVAAREVMKDMLDDGVEFDKIRRYLGNVEEVLAAIYTLDDDEAVLLHEGRYVEVINTRTIEWSFDTKNVRLAAIDMEG